MSGADEKVLAVRTLALVAAVRGFLAGAIVSDYSETRRLVRVLRRAAARAEKAAELTEGR